MSYPCPPSQLPKGRGIWGLRCFPAPPLPRPLPTPHQLRLRAPQLRLRHFYPPAGPVQAKDLRLEERARPSRSFYPKADLLPQRRTDKGTALPGGVITREGDPGFIARTHTEQVNPGAHSRASPAAPGLPDLARERACCPLRTRSEPEPPAGSPGPFEITCFLLKIQENFAF